MAAAPDGTLYAVWLDLRGKGTTLYGSQSTDGGRTWTKNYQVYASPEGTICQCCHPSLSIDAQGIVSVMWRNAVGGSRDMYVTSSKDHFASAQKLGAGTWKLDACPMDGGGIAVENGQPISAWRRETDIYLAEGAHERRVGAGKDVALARSNGTYLAWTHDGGIRSAHTEGSATCQASAGRRVRYTGYSRKRRCTGGVGNSRDHRVQAPRSLTRYAS